MSAIIIWLIIGFRIAIFSLFLLSQNEIFCEIHTTIILQFLRAIQLKINHFCNTKLQFLKFGKLKKLCMIKWICRQWIMSERSLITEYHYFRYIPRTARKGWKRKWHNAKTSLFWLTSDKRRVLYPLRIVFRTALHIERQIVSHKISAWLLIRQDLCGGIMILPSSHRHRNGGGCLRTKQRWNSYDIVAAHSRVSQQWSEVIPFCWGQR